MGKKVYAIKEGFDFLNNKKIENKIVTTWSECLSYVKGVKGAKYKSFESKALAEQYLKENNAGLKKEDGNYPLDCMHIYVDGSYNELLNEYSYGMVAVKNNIVLDVEGEAFKSNSNNRQVAGELKAAIKGVEYALLNHEKKVVIFHDYAGICYHATGFWERKEDSSIKYYEKMQHLMKKGIEIIFVKVDSHTGDLFNELADEKCKELLKIPSDNIVATYLKDNVINVDNENVKEEIIRISSGNSDNIIVFSKNRGLEKTDKKEKDNKQELINDINSILNKISNESLVKVLKYVKRIKE